MAKKPTPSDSTGLQKMIESIEDGLKHYTPKELSEAIENFINKKQIKTPEVNFLLNCISKDYNVSVRHLKTPIHRGQNQIAKKLLICLLVFKLKLSQRHIASAILNNTHKVCGDACRYFSSLDVKYTEHREFKEKYDHYSLKLDEFIQQKI